MHATNVSPTCGNTIGRYERKRAWEKYEKIDIKETRRKKRNINYNYNV